jgi:uncharacterized protein (DUF302 family)
MKGRATHLAIRQFAPGLITVDTTAVYAEFPGEQPMSYYFSKTLDLPFNDAIAHVTAELKKEGFGVLTEIDVSGTLKEKIDVDFRPYTILGACNPNYAYQALQSERHIGTMLPCNVIVQATDDGTEVAAVDPIASMSAIENDQLGEVAQQVQGLLRKVIESL